MSCWVREVCPILPPLDKDQAISPPTFMACIRWSQPGHIPKRSHGWKPNMTPFLPTTKPLSLNPLIIGPLPLYRLSIGLWCSGPCVLTLLSSIFVFFQSYIVSAVADWFCLVLLRVYSIRVYPLWKRVWALGLALFSFVFCLIFFSFSFLHFLLLTLSYFYMHFLLCLSFPLVWLFFPSRNSYH